MITGNSASKSVSRRSAQLRVSPGGNIQSRRWRVQPGLAEAG